ncbi:unnamed protein product [Urochloa humidicola]
MAVVEVESKDSWKWFLRTLKEDLGIDNTYSWTIMTDKQKGLIPAVQQVFPDSEHRFCVRHLYSNFQQKFKGEILKNQLWACARSTTVMEWNINMDKMKSLNNDAYVCCEVFNKYILEAKELPILSILEKIKCQLMTRIVNKQNELREKFQGSICPKIRNKILKRSEWANLCYAMPAGQGVFQVNERDNQYIVELATRHCDCKRWDLTGIPCNHAIAALRHERIPTESVVPACYSTESFSKAYEFNIWPCKDKTEWEHVNGPKILPPVYEKKVGRPPKSRRRQPFEVQGKHGPNVTSVKFTN